jgi:hypothetical protein
VRIQGDFDPESEQNPLVVACQPPARLDRFQGFHPESAQNIESDHHAGARTAYRAAPPNTGGRQPDSPAYPPGTAGGGPAIDTHAMTEADG